MRIVESTARIPRSGPQSVPEQDQGEDRGDTQLEGLYEAGIDPPKPGDRERGKDRGRQDHHGGPDHGDSLVRQQMHRNSFVRFRCRKRDFTSHHSHIDRCTRRLQTFQGVTRER